MSTTERMPSAPPRKSTPTDDDIEAIIQLATSSHLSDGRPLRDTRTQLFVGNLPYRVRWQDLKDLFRKAGTVLRADVSLGPDNRSRGYGTVLLATAEDAGRAVDMFNGYSWQTRILEVRPDRLPPHDFDNSAVGSGYASPIPMSAQSFQPNTSFSTLPSTSNGPADDLAYSVYYGLERLNSDLGIGRNLFVGNLPFHCQWQDLKDLFRQAGAIIRADVALGPDGRSRGFGTVVLATDVDAERAVKMFNGYEYNGRALKVHYDKFSQSGTAPTSPVLQGSFAHSLPAPSYMQMSPSNSVFHHSSSSGRSSPFEANRFKVAHPGQQLSRQEILARMTDDTTHSVMCADHSRNFSVSSATESRKSTTSEARKHTKQSSPPQTHPRHPGPISLPPPPAIPQISHSNMSPMHMMTPHGLPPITPSMPPFNFLPQNNNIGYSNHTPTSNPGFFAFPLPSPTLHSPMHHPSQQLLNNFSPGGVLSPGAFWGRPGANHNPLINPAVGAPVHGYFAGGYPSVSPLEPAGYFDTGYFPPVTGASALGTSALANEILRDKDRGEKEWSQGVDEKSTTPPSDSTDTRPTSSTNTSWHSSDDAQNSVDDTTSESESHEHGARSRTHSMSGYKRPDGVRTTSDPAETKTVPS